MASPTPSRLPGRTLAELSAPSDARGWLDLASVWGGLVAVAAAAHALAHPAGYALAVVGIAALQNRLIVLAHECWHHKAFRSPALNLWIGSLFYSYPVGTPFRSDRRRHLDHHRLVGLSDDPDFSDYERPGFRQGDGALRYLAGQLVGAKVLQRVLALLSRDTAPARDPRGVTPAPAEMGAVVAAQLLLLAAFTAFGRPWEYGLLWILPLATLANFLVSLRAFVEHASARRDAPGDARLYDFSPGPLQRFLVSPCRGESRCRCRAAASRR